MTFWQRAITIILLMVFTPASVLAGTPLRICVGDDGHRAVEFVLSAAHHAAEGEGGHAVQEPHNRTASAFSDTDCSDSPLLSVGQMPSRIARQIKFVLPLDDLPVFTATTPLAILPAFVDSSQPVIRAFDIAYGNSQLTALRTVVLLI
jgi:hypothetical protein